MTRRWQGAPVVYDYRGVTFRYGGGPYIDVGQFATADVRGHRRDFRAFDVINVWDYATDTGRCHTTTDLKQRARQWYEDNAAQLMDYRMSVGM